MFLLLFVGHFLLVCQVNSNRSGAPGTSCVDMMPRHNNVSGSGIIEGQPAASSPYTIAVNTNTYSAGAAVQVVINDNRNLGFKGILLQARNPGGSVPLGTWTNLPANTKALTCTAESDSVTHSNTNQKQSGTMFSWIAPNKNVGQVQFLATVAETRKTFWVKLVSDKTITYSSGCNLRMHGLYTAIASVIAMIVSM
nr:putative defense protein 3 [Ciona intestinalis]|eukprot:XP_009860739.1 putative defense protein 3 [Ciona intestinalis]